MGPALLPAAMAVMAVSAVAQGRAQQENYEYQAQVARNNQQISALNAGYATERGDIMAQQKNQQTSSLMGAQVAAEGASGADVSSGSNLNVRKSTAAMGAFDVSAIRNAAAREAFGYKVQGMNYGAAAQLDEMTAQNSMTTGLISAAGDSMMAGAKVSGKWDWMSAGGGGNVGESQNMGIPMGNIS